MPIEKRSNLFLSGDQSVEIGYCQMPEGTDFEAVSWVMLRHTIQEMSNLASFLPEVYNRCEGKITMPGK